MTLYVTRILGMLEILVSLITMLIHVFLFYVMSKTTLLHTSFRTIFRIFSVCASLYTTLSCALVIICHAEEGCSRVHIRARFDMSLTNIIYELHQSASYSYWLAISFLTVERAIATYFVRTYEDRFHSLRWQLLLIVGFVTVDITENFCRVAIPEPTLLIVCFSNTFTNLAVMYLIKHHNGRKNSIGKALSFRYQVTENLLISKAILPLTYIAFVFAFVLAPLMILMITQKNEITREPYAGLFYLVSAMFPLSYTIGFLHSAAMRKILDTTISSRDQYEAERNKQDELWRVAR